MATVRISGQLKEDIIDNAKESFTNRIEQVIHDNPRPESWGQRIYDTEVPSKDKAIALSLPDGWCEKTTQVQMNGFDHVPEDRTYDVELTRELTDGFRVENLKWDIPSQPVPVSGTHMLKGYHHNVDYRDPRYEWLKSEYATWLKPIKDILVEREKFVDDVRTLLDSAKTLAPLLKKWSGLWQLVPESAKNRHREVYEKPKADEIEDKTKDIDFDSLTTSITFNKLSD